jgi:hypothetical protein
MRQVWNYFSYHGLGPPVAQLGASARHFHYVEFGKADIADMNNTPHVPLRQITEE